MSVRILALALITLVSLANAVLAGPLQDDLKARRARLMERLTPQSLAIVWSAPTRVFSLDVDYEYRQDSNLLYLTGITQPDTILVLMPGNKTQREILFVSEPNPRREHWNGHILTKDEATAESGIPAVYYSGQFESFLAAMFAQTSVRRAAPGGDAGVRHLLCGGGRRPRQSGAAAGSAAAAVGSADAAVRVRQQGARAVLQRRGDRHLGHPVGPAAGQDALRAGA